MKSATFEESISELVDHLVAVTPLEQEQCMLRLRRALANRAAPKIKLVKDSDEGGFDNVPV